MEKLSNPEAELNKNVAYIKKRVFRKENKHPPPAKKKKLTPSGKIC